MTEDGALKGRVALVTGASRGIGAALAKALAEKGAHVLLLARTTGALEAVDDAIRAMGQSATIIPQDLTELETLDRIGLAVGKRFGKLDILVANAGMLGTLSPVAQTHPKMWDDVFRINVTANQRLIRALDPLLRASDQGRAVFVTSGIVGMDAAFWGAYAASKAALEQMVRCYAAETRQSSLRVNLFDPGVVRTEMRAAAFPGENPEKLLPPESVVPGFLELVLPSCRLHGQIRKAA